MPNPWAGAPSIDRHARDPETRKGLYGFSVGGGYSDPEATACPECLTKATPHISGMFAHLFKASP